MGLEPCRECGRQISSEAVLCPGCGAPGPAQQTRKRFGFSWRSKTAIFGIPLIHVAIGRDASGRLFVAKGVIAIGQFGVGLITIAQFGIGFLFGFGQFSLGLITLAQFALGILVGVGQVATGILAVGQVALGIYALCQAGIAKYMWSPGRVDMEAVALFYTIQMRLRALIGL